MRALEIAFLGLVLAVGLVLVPTSEAQASKEKFVRNKPHVNIGGPYGLSNEVISVGLGVVEPGGIGIGVPARKPCQGEVDIRIEDAGTGASLSSATGLRLVSGVFQSVSYASPSASIAVRVVIVARDMEVDGKECVLRGQLEFQDITSGQINRSFPIRRADFTPIEQSSSSKS